MLSLGWQVESPVLPTRQLHLGFRGGEQTSEASLRAPKPVVTVDESIREEDGSDDEEKDEDKKDDICQLSNQRTASQRRDKSCAPSH